MSEDQKPDFSTTVFLPTTDFPMRGNLPVREPEILARWKSEDLYAALRKTSKGRKPFILHDGPPYANGNIHVGHAENKILKDFVVRTRQMMGLDAPYVPGWDCHGLPIEWKIEEEYRAKGLDKDAVPVLQFRAECRAFAAKWRDVQSEEFQRLGVLGDWKHPYTTMTNRAEAQIVREIHKFLMNGLLYKGVKPVMWSVVEKTALAEAEVEYQDHKSTTLWVRFPIVTPSAELADYKDVGVVIWTTTPWTIPANRAIAYGDFAYALFRVDAVADNATARVGDTLLVAQDLVDSFCADAKIAAHTILRRDIHGEDLQGTICAHPFRDREGTENYFAYDVPLLFGDFVTTEAGTGFVHVAPGHGEDDFHLGRKNNIAFDETVGDDGVYLPNIKGFAGLYVYKPDGKEGEANVAVIKALAATQALLAKKPITHSYPHSWRSKAPLIFRTTPQWFIALDKKPEGGTQTLRELAMQAIADTKWYPAIGENRIAGMVSSRPDWCISRQRAWGVPIALFVSKHNGQPLRDKAVLDRIATAFEAEGADAWYSHPAQFFLGDAYKAEDFTQIFDIVDVWFESGATHAFCLDQAEGASEWPELSWPADLYLEGSDQHRGWFHSSLLEACGSRGKAPYRSVLTHGFTLDEKGNKFSKSLGNGVAPQDVIDKMGADILRLWVAASDTSEDVGIGPNILKQVGETYRRFRNTLRYLLGALHGFTDAEKLEPSAMPELERWALARLYAINAEIHAAMARHDYNGMMQTLHHFCAVDLSAFYFDIRKDALYCDDPTATRRRAARTVMALIFDHLTTWLAPLLVFTTEEAWRARHGDATTSVHTQLFPSVPDAWADADLCERWDDIRKLRRVATGAMERARNDKIIGSSLQAALVLHATDEAQARLDGVDLAELCIASHVTFATTPAPKNAFTLDDEPRLSAVVSVATGHKCERCWQVLDDVSNHLCPRCHAVVKA